MGRQRSRQRRPGTRRAAAGRIRVIAGEWRGRLLPVPDGEGLRPTGDRLRETLFNWLAPSLRGARCLDLFAGSGALGIEALSRGARHCDFVDSSSVVTKNLRAVLETLGAEHRGAVHAANALAFLSPAPGIAQQRADATPWDVVFVDPPFARNLAEPALTSLISGHHLAPGSLVYLEHARETEVAIPQSLEILKRGSAGAVDYRLLEYVGEDGPGRSEA